MNRSKKLKQMLKHVSIATLTAAAMASPASANINAPAKHGNSKRAVKGVDRIHIDSRAGMAGDAVMHRNSTITGAAENDTVVGVARDVTVAGASRDDVMRNSSIAGASHDDFMRNSTITGATSNDTIVIQSA